MYVCSFKRLLQLHLKCFAGLLFNQGNDASKAMAEHIAGNEGTFVHMMNQEAKRIGMTNTQLYQLYGYAC